MVGEVRRIWPVEAEAWGGRPGVRSRAEKGSCRWLVLRYRQVELFGTRHGVRQGGEVGVGHRLDHRRIGLRVRALGLDT